MNKGFKKFLVKNNLSNNTITAYEYAVKVFLGRYKVVNKDAVLAYKGYLMEKYKAKTVNLRIQAINKYLDYIGKQELRITAIKIQQKPYLENVISDADYEYLKSALKKDNK